MSERPKKKKRTGLLLSVALAALALSAGLFAASRMDGVASDEQTAQLRRDIMRAAVTCYAIEGRYPQSLSYISENYGVHIDSSRYIVTYDLLGGNVAPSVSVLKRGVWK